MFKRVMPFAGGLATLGILVLGGCNQGGNQAGGSSAVTADATQGASGKKPKIAYVTNGVASFWVIAETGAKAAGAKVNADVDVLMPADISDQKRMVEDLMTRGVDGIAISPIDPAHQTPLID